MDTSNTLRAIMRIRPAFNGAMTSQPWIRGRPSLSTIFIMSLQWSHDLSAMDTRIINITDAEGNTLQWSHDLSAMDTLQCPLRWDYRLAGFNGAMTSQPWILVNQTHSSTTHESQLQWSHDLSAMDTRTPSLTGTVQRLRFNGAMTSQPWIPDGSPDRRRSLLASMEP